MILEDLKAAIEKKAKGTHVSILSQSEIATSKEFIPTPALDLNRIISGSLYKGFPNKTLSMFVGPEASGKSSFMCLCLAEAQRKGYTPVVIDTEGAWDEKFVTRWGLDPTNMLYVYTPWIDQVSVALAQIIESGDKKLAIALDSIGGLEVGKLLVDATSGDVKADQGRLQKDIKRMLKLFVNICKAQESIGFAAGHYYGSPSQYGAAEEIGGGKYVKLSADIVVSLKKYKKYENPNATGIARGDVLGNEIKAITLKNRYYPPFNECVVDIDFTKGINSMAGILDIALDIGVISKAGSWYSMGEERLGQGMANVTQTINTDKKLKENICKKVEDHIKTTGYSTVNEYIAEAEELLEAEELSEIPVEVPEKKTVAKKKTVVKKKTVKK